MFKRRKPDDPHPTGVDGPLMPAMVTTGASRPDPVGAPTRPTDTGLGVPPFRPAPAKEAPAMSRAPFAPTPTPPAPQPMPGSTPRPVVAPPARATSRDSA